MLNLNENKSFCILPFVHLHVNEKNNIKLCCLAKEQPEIGKYTTDFDFKNNTNLQEVRRAMLAGNRIPHCQVCYSYEDGGADSSRLRDSKEWFEKLNITELSQTPVELMYYDIRNDNLCNLSCRMCNPQFSSQLAKEFNKLGLPYSPAPMSFGFTNVVDFDVVKKIYVAGGEPSLMPEFRNFLMKAIELGRTDIEIRMNTNVTNLNTEYRNLLSQFTNLNIVCSIDGYDHVNKYIRWPADWESIVDNMHWLLSITPCVSVNVAVSIWNISNLSKLVFFLEKEFPQCSVLLNQVMFPPHQMITAFPEYDVALADLELIKQSIHYTQDMSFKSKVDFFIGMLRNSSPDGKVVTEFFKFNDMLDKSRNVKLVDYIPELEKCRPNAQTK